MFCPKCKSIMIPKLVDGKRLLACSCGFKQGAENVTLKETSKENGPAVSVVEGEETLNPVVEAECPKCGNDKAEYWEVQTRSADEPATRFYKCTKCKGTRREYK